MEPIQRLAQPYHTPMDQCVIQQCLFKILDDDGDVYVDAIQNRPKLLLEEQRLEYRLKVDSKD